MISIFFIGGHPKNNSQQLSEKLISWNEYSAVCEINNLIFYQNSVLNIFHRSGNENSIKAIAKTSLLHKLYLQKNLLINH